MRQIILLGLAAGFALIGLAGLAGYLLSQPTVLRVAVERDSQEEAVIAAASQKFARDHAAIRLKPFVVEDLTESARALEQGRVDLAVVRSDVAMPADSASLLILHPDLVLFVAPAGSDIRTIGEMKNRKIGVLRDTIEAHGNPRPGLLETIFGQYDVPIGSITTVQLGRNDIEHAIEDKSVDAVLAVGTPEGGSLAEAVAAVTTAGHGEPVFIPVAEAKAISERLPYLETGNAVRGTFHGSQPRPIKNLETLAASTRLVARTTLADDTAALVTRLMLAAKPVLALRAPIANRIEAPATDKDAALPAHPGVAAYIDDEEQTFFDKYSDAIYISALCLSALGTAAAALASRIKFNRPVPEDLVLSRLVEIVKASREADADSLDALESEADELLAFALTPEALRLKTEAQRVNALGMAFEHARHALKERRKSVVRPALSHFEARIVGK
jgi:TRAP-type uncharacterized transport system substrate-binding protein